MLSKDKRLNLKKDFKWVASGKRIDNPLITLFIRIGDNSSPRVGIAVSSKHFKKAVERNKARRLTSAGFESLYTKLPANINIVALPKVGVLKVKSGDLLLELENILNDQKIIS